jgi:chemotaxis protein CheD
MMHTHLKPRVREPTLLHLIQGEFLVTGDRDTVLTTTLGSCVAACIRDPGAGIGGMNHFLLPWGEEKGGSKAQRFGAYAMELLINSLLSAGARRERLEAKLFGGAQLSESLPDVGAQNAAFAEHFLEHEGIALHGGHVGGRHARRVQFWPVAGRVRQLVLASADKELIRTEVRERTPRRELGTVELFDTEK